MVGRRMLASVSLILAAGLSHAGPDAMTPNEARHLISRTGFGAAPLEIAALSGLPYDVGVDLLLGSIETSPFVAMPPWVDAPDYPEEFIWTLGRTERELFFSNRWMEIEELSGWWFAQMIATPSPLSERLTLFWHDHFATSYDTVENPQWMARQNRFFRQNAAGNFKDLAHGILKDPAMLVYLSNTENVAEGPNENLGREFLELFTLGEGRGYDQADVVAAARMLTGHTIAELSAPVYTFDPEVHDSGIKTLFGQSGRYGAADLVNMALAHPEFGSYIIEKLWLTFVSDVPDPAEIARLNQIWHENDLELRPLLRALFLSDAFWAHENRGRLVKSPVEMIVGTLRSLGTSVEDARDLAWLSNDMGQGVFFPPNVGGWPEGIDWINDASVTARATALRSFAFSTEAFDVASTGMMQMAPAPPGTAAMQPTDLRVGQVFAIDAVASSGHIGGLFVLFDVSFSGQTWRALPVWIESNWDEDFSGYGILRTDCAPQCFANVETEDDDWVWYAPYRGVLEEGLSKATAQDIDLLRAVAFHMPDLIKSTRGQSSWRPDEEETDDDYTPRLQDVVKASRDMARDSVRAIGRPVGDVVFASSAPGLLGLQGGADVSNVGEIDDYIEAAEAARVIPAVPATSYASARDWLNDLPIGGLESERAASALLAVPRQSGAGREEMFATDADALVRALILSPEYQVN